MKRQQCLPLEARLRLTNTYLISFLSLFVFVFVSVSFFLIWTRIKNNELKKQRTDNVLVCVWITDFSVFVLVFLSLHLYLYLNQNNKQSIAETKQRQCLRWEYGSQTFLVAKSQSKPDRGTTPLY